MNRRTMSSLKLIIEYDGSRYNGFQRQTSNAERPPKRPRYCDEGRKKGVACTIQDCLEEAFLQWKPDSTLESLRLRFAGRTDKGVHARGQIIVVDLKVQERDWEVVKALNSRLPLDISVRSVEPCCSTLEPRLACTKKEYTYTIRYRRLDVDLLGDTLPICLQGGPHSIRTAHDPPCLWICPWALDDGFIPSLCEILAGNHDYSAFIHKSDRFTHNNLKDLTKFDFEVIQETPEEIPAVTGRFRLQAKGFGRSMVRNLIGFVVDVSRGVIDANEAKGIWTADKANMVNAAPASGLCLEQVWF
jgi:tRNA pseudouridine38-40 synthase